MPSATEHMNGHASPAVVQRHPDGSSGSNTSSDLAGHLPLNGSDEYVSVSHDDITTLKISLTSSLEELKQTLSSLQTQLKHYHRIEKRMKQYENDILLRGLRSLKIAAIEKMAKRRYEDPYAVETQAEYFAGRLDADNIHELSQGGMLGLEDVQVLKDFSKEMQCWKQLAGLLMLKENEREREKFRRMFKFVTGKEIEELAEEEEE